MQDEKKKLLLIWPPSFKCQYIPLGIPSLTSFIKKNTNFAVDIFDFNLAYVKSDPLYYLLFNLNKEYQRLNKGLSNKLYPSKKRLWIKKIIKKILAIFYFLSHYTINSILRYINKSEKNSVPWSLENILNATNSKYPRIQKRLRKISHVLSVNQKFDLIGFSVIYPEQLFYTLLLIPLLKKRLGKDVSIVLGGSQISKHIETIKDHKNIHNLIDFLIINDGEGPLKDLLNSLSKHIPSNIPNMYTKNTVGFIKSSEDSFFLNPSDFVIPDFTGFNKEFYKKYLPIRASIGCYWSKCSFCTYSNKYKKSFSIAKAEKIINTIKYLYHQKDFSNYLFVDDALPIGFLKIIAQSLIDEKINIRYECNITAEINFCNPTIIKLLKDSGLKKVSIGIESINPRILSLMDKAHKDLERDDITAILKSIKGYGIKIGLHIIIGFPTETIEEAEDTLHFLVDNKAYYDYVSIQPFCLEENTSIFLNPKKFGIDDIHSDDKNQGQRLGYDYRTSSGMTQKQISDFIIKDIYQTLIKEKINFQLD